MGTGTLNDTILWLNDYFESETDEATVNALGVSQGGPSLTVAESETERQSPNAELEVGSPQTDSISLATKSVPAGGPSQTTLNTARTSLDRAPNDSGITSGRPSHYKKALKVSVARRILEELDPDLIRHNTEVSRLVAELKNQRAKVATRTGEKTGTSKRTKGSFACNLCGDSCKGHVCPFVAVSTPVLEFLLPHIPPEYRGSYESTLELYTAIEAKEREKKPSQLKKASKRKKQKRKRCR